MRKRGQEIIKTVDVIYGRLLSPSLSSSANGKKTGVQKAAADRSVCRQTFEPLTDLASRKVDSFHGSSFLPVLRSFPEFVVILQKRRQDFDVCK